MKFKTSILKIIFWLIVLVDIFGLSLNVDVIHSIAKPLLMPVLMLLLFIATPFSKVKNMVLIALFFSWLGDIFLLFDKKNSLYFILGLACFLITHVLYIFCFLKIKNSAISLLKKKPLIIIPALFYVVCLIWLLFPQLHNLTVPVIIYAIVICTMLLSSLHIYYKAKKTAAILFICGAFFFVASDSLLAINKFYSPITLAGVFIMCTYCIAQYFIVTGFIKQLIND